MLPSIRMRQVMDMIRRSLDPDAQWAGKYMESRELGFLTDGYKSATCDEWHAGLRLSFAADSPGIYSNMKREERDGRCVYGSDQNTIDQKWFLIRGWRKMITGLRLERRSGITRERAWELAALSCTSNARVCAKPCGCLVFR